MDWQEKKSELMNTHNELSTYFQNEYHSDENAFTSSMKAYIQKGGIYKDSASSGDAQNALKIFNKISGKLQGFETLNENAMKTIRQLSEKYDTGKLFKENSDLQNHIEILEKKKSISLNNLKLAKERNMSFKNNRSDITSHKLFLLKAPVPESYIPYMWSTSIIFLGFGLLTLGSTFSFTKMNFSSN